ncbi:hypothetical protein F4806DRAFT_6221 [Annulohypoxylon nitens]|nr:hypothetical protein F4806DRAFT_6221 [Annulohypoxylon nitens]
MYLRRYTSYLLLVNVALSVLRTFFTTVYIDIMTMSPLLYIRSIYRCKSMSENLQRCSLGSQRRRVWHSHLTTIPSLSPVPKTSKTLYGSSRQT